MKKQLILCFVFFALSTKLFSQSGFEILFLADKNDSKKLLTNYFSPTIKGYLDGLNNGWFHSAKAHKPFGFDLSVNLVNVIHPNNSKVFTTNNLASLNATKGVFSSSTSVGNKKTTPIIINTTINGQTVTASSNFNGGSDGSIFENTASIPIAQISLGVSNGFDVMLRFTPGMKVNNDNESLTVLGFGIKKEITNWFKKSENLPLHLSILAGYTSMKANYGIKNQSFPTGNQSGIEVQNALSEFSLSSFTFQALGSLEWDRFGFFGSMGYGYGNSKFTTTGVLRGQYQGNSKIEIKDLDIPDDIKFNSNNLSATVGTKINLRYFKIYGSYSFQEFNTTNIGVAFSLK